MAHLLAEIDMTAVYFFLAVFGALLSVYWAAVLAQDPSMRHVPPFIAHLRRVCILGLAIALLSSVMFGYNKSWEPWPPYLLIVAAFDAYLMSAIASAIARNKLCASCPALPVHYSASRGMRRAPN